MTLELEVENLILISFLELVFFAAKSRVVVILFPPTFHRLILVMLGAFHENQQHCKKFPTEKLSKIDGNYILLFLLAYKRSKVYFKGQLISKANFKDFI